jgi:tetratricopeptide (TPR) repeat protein
MTARRIVTWVVVLGILAVIAWAAWWFRFSPSAQFRQEYGQLVRWQEEYRPMVLPPFPGMAPAAAPEVYDARVKGATERLGRDLRSFDGTSGLELLRDCFRSHAAKGDPGPNPSDANRLVAQRIGVQYCLGLPADRLRPTLKYVNQSEWGDAILPDLLKIFVERLLRDGPAEFQALSEEAHQKKEAGDYPGAMEAYRKALAYAEKWQLPVPEARTRIGMGSTLRKMNRLKEPEAEYLKAKAVLDGVPHPEADDATLGNNLGLLYMDLDRWEDAYTWMSKAAEVDRRRTSGQPVFLALDLINLIAICGKLGRLEEGARLGDEAIAFCCRGELGNHPYCAAAKAAAAGIQADQGRLAEAEALYQSAIDIYERLDPKPAVVLAQAYDNHAFLLEKMGRTAAAREARAKAAAYRQATPPAAPAP